MTRPEYSFRIQPNAGRCAGIAGSGPRCALTNVHGLRRNVRSCYSVCRICPNGNAIHPAVILRSWYEWRSRQPRSSDRPFLNSLPWLDCRSNLIQKLRGKFAILATIHATGQPPCRQRDSVFPLPALGPVVIRSASPSFALQTLQRPEWPSAQEGAAIVMNIG